MCKKYINCDPVEKQLGFLRFPAASSDKVCGDCSCNEFAHHRFHCGLQRYVRFSLTEKDLDSAGSCLFGMCATDGPVPRGPFWSLGGEFTGKDYVNFDVAWRRLGFH